MGWAGGIKLAYLSLMTDSAENAGADKKQQSNNPPHGKKNFCSVALHCGTPLILVYPHVGEVFSSACILFLIPHSNSP